MQLTYLAHWLAPVFSALVLAGPLSASELRQDVDCSPVAGADALLGKSEKRYIIVGERHGTAEIPPLFGDLACLASASGPLIVGLEMEADQQPALDAFLSSDGSAEAKRAWRRAKHWRLKDGRGSVAMWNMIDRVRQLKAQGRDVTALAFMRQAGSVEARERAMADAWTAALADRGDARLLILIGSVHAESELIGQSVPAASFVPRSARVTLSYVPWEAIRCGFAPCPASAAGRRILDKAPSEWRWPRYDVHYTVGVPFTPSGAVPDSPQ
jgi:hypothetical protein